MGLFSLLQPLWDIPVAVIDTETTGASAELGDRITEIGIVRYEHARAVAQYQQLIDPCRRISPAVTALTGITQDMVAGQPRFDQQRPAMMRVLGGALVLGHNVGFDLGFLSREFSRCGASIDAALGDVPVLDTVRIARRRFGRGGNALQRLSRRLGITPATAHRALADAITTAQLFQTLIEPLGGWQLSLCDAIAHQGGPIGLLPVNPRQPLLPLELEEALEQGRPVMMEYLDADDQRTHRLVEPIHVRRARGELILVAHCHLRNARRTFKLDRIVHLTRIEDATTPTAPEPLARANSNRIRDSAPA